MTQWPAWGAKVLQQNCQLFAYWQMCDPILPLPLLPEELSKHIVSLPGVKTKSVLNMLCFSVGCVVVKYIELLCC